MSDFLQRPGFCMAAFVHSCIWTNGRVIPCCINYSTTLGDLRQNSVEEVFSNANSALVEFRKQIISGTPPESCWRCTDPENLYGVASYRQHFNQSYGHLVDSLGIQENGEVSNPQTASYDVRLSNLCNLRCRMCDPDNSNAIAQEENRHFGTSHPKHQQPFEDATQFTEFFLKNIKSVDYIYFCGGEPLMLDYHYRLLELLIEHGRTDVSLRYNTNCTTLSFKDKKVTNYWKFFSKISLGMSLDASGRRGEYIRDGSDWQKVKENVRRIRQECPHIMLNWSPTIQLLNCLSAPELHIELLDEKLVDLWDYIILEGPDHFNIRVLPFGMKEKMRRVWLNYKEQLRTRGVGSELLNKIDHVLAYLDAEDRSELLPVLASELAKYDKIRAQDYRVVFPELAEIFQ